MDSVRYVCPVCGYDGLEEPPWKGNSPSDDICPSCGTQFGYHDAAGRTESGRKVIYERLRQVWIEKGMPWHSASVESSPPGWDPRVQLRRVSEGQLDLPGDGARPDGV